MKTLFQIVCFISLIYTLASTNIDCGFNFNNNYWVLGRIYCCHVKNDPNIDSLQSSNVNSSSGMHFPGKSNFNVNGIDSYQKTIQYFPIGLDKVFDNLKLISIWHGRIKEIHQSDLKPFQKLVYLSLHKNNIEIIEDGLFDFNPNLEVITLSNNRISHIDQFVFDNLVKLAYLGFDANPCINMEARASQAMVRDIVRIVKSKCNNPNILRSRQDTNAIGRSRNLEFTELNDDSSEDHEKMSQMIIILSEKVAKLEEKLKNMTDSETVKRT
ncbi:unnamed protein product [Chironomus riparius]|uniref:Uncharacterized protein n=1 Tax=Chironomus riparius TaxID=315576 RepID=A0A9N9S348_9DIPT|nr:unnamed protein product [Chironomus riparius]